MAESDLNEAAKRVEVAVKLKARELTPAAQQELLERTAEMLEEVTVETLVDLFLEIAGLPDTLSTVAEVMAVMDLDLVLEVVDAWVTAGYGKELGVVFDYLSDEVLSSIWTGMSVEDIAAVYMYLSDDVVTVVLAVVTPYPQVVVHLKGALDAYSQLDMVMENLGYVEWHIVFDGLTAADLGDASMLILVQADFDPRLQR